MTARIMSLLKRCCPSTIGWLVISIYINSVNGMYFTRSFTHIFSEAFSARLATLAYLPARTDGNTSSSVIFEGSVIRILTPCNHHVAYGVHASASKPVCSPNLAEDYLLEAPTRSGVPREKILGCTFNGITAFTTAQPHTLIPFVPTKVGLNREFAVNLSSSILKCLLRLDAWWRHNDAALVLTHGDYGLSSSEHPALLASGARAFSPETSTLSIC